MRSYALLEQADNRLTTTSQDAKPWIVFFSHMAAAEHAAKLQACFAYEAFVRLNRARYAKFYKEMASEEGEHYRLISGLCPEVIELNQVSRQIYAANRCLCSGYANLIERLAIVHLVFEPSAMACASYIHNIAEDIFSAGWAFEIKQALGQVLKDEALHIKLGRKILRDELLRLNCDDQVKISRSLRTHQAFLTAGIKSFFRNHQSQRYHAHVLIERYDYAQTNASKGVSFGKL